MQIRHVAAAFLDSRGAEFQRTGEHLTFVCPLDGYGGSCSGWLNVYGDDELAVGFSVLHAPAVAGDFVKALPQYEESLFLYAGPSDDRVTIAWESRKQYVHPSYAAVYGCLTNIFTKAEYGIGDLLKLFNADARIRPIGSPEDLARLLTRTVGLA